MLDIQWVPVPEAGIRVSRYPTTVSQYASLDPERQLESAGIAQSPPGATEPRTGTTWSDAVEFAARAKTALGLSVRLPTGTEWEAIGRLVPAPRESGLSGTLGRIAPVGAADDPNAAVCDVRGNIWQWCRDEPGESDEAQLAEGPRVRLLKGGSWRRRQEFADPQYRCWVDDDYTSDDVGVRLVCDL